MADQVTLTLPFTLSNTKPRTAHYAEVKVTAKDAGKYLGAMLVLDNRVIEQLGIAGAKDLTITVTATKTKPTFKLDAPAKADDKPADAPKAEAKAS
jgi:hypothetical protein